jgi:P-type Ca2+ transporter type 2C
MIGGQIMIIYVGGKAFHVRPLNGAQWGYSVVLGSLSLPVAVIIRLIPDEWCAKLIPSRKWKKQLAPELVRGNSRRDSDLTFIKKFRGGRVSSLKFKWDDKMDHMKDHMRHPIHGNPDRSGSSSSGEDWVVR